jgi:hypothetical protein
MRVTVSIPKEVDKIIRDRQIKTMVKTNKTQTYSKTFVDIVMESEK